MSRENLKRQAAEAAATMVRGGASLGVGTGSTVDFFIAALKDVSSTLGPVVASSDATEARLGEIGVKCAALNDVGTVSLYVDGADEINCHFQMIKGGGGALTREKILAAAAEQFVCVVDESKVVERLGKFPLPIEVLPMARSLVARALAAMGGAVQWREGVVTDNGNWILDVSGLEMIDAVALESEINQVPGVVANGLFARRMADVMIQAGAGGVQVKRR